jgi:hypothetical protein
MGGAVLASSPAPAGASTPPTVTSVGVTYPFNDGRGFPQVNIDWGDYANAVTGVVFIGEASAIIAPPSELSPVIDYGSYVPPSPRSYQPAACPTGCSGTTLDQIRSSPEIVLGPWWRPPVSSTISLAPPTVSAVRNGSPGIQVTVDPGGHTDAPALAVVRDGHTVQVLTPQDPSFTDLGPFSSSTATYTAIACYSDCAGTMIDDGFAQETPAGPRRHHHDAALEQPVDHLHTHDGRGRDGDDLHRLHPHGHRLPGADGHPPVRVRDVQRRDEHLHPRRQRQLRHDGGRAVGV